MRAFQLAWVTTHSESVETRIALVLVLWHGTEGLEIFCTVSFVPCSLISTATAGGQRQ